MTPVDLTWGNLPSGYCFPSSLDTFKTDIFNLLSGTVDVNGVVISFTTPAVGDRDKAWFKLDSSGRPMGYFIYLGSWLQLNTRQQGGERIIWAESEANLWAYDGGDGTDPGAVAPTPTTGAMWQRDTAFNFRIPIGVGTNPTTYDGNPATSIAQGATAGEERHVLTDPEIPNYPNLGVQESAGDGFFGSVHSTGATVNGVYLFGESGPGNQNKALVEEFGNDESHNTLPPVIGVFFAKRTARLFYTG